MQPRKSEGPAKALANAGPGARSDRAGGGTDTQTVPCEARTRRPDWGSLPCIQKRRRTPCRSVVAIAWRKRRDDGVKRLAGGGRLGRGRVGRTARSTRLRHFAPEARRECRADLYRRDPLHAELCNRRAYRRRTCANESEYGRNKKEGNGDAECHRRQHARRFHDRLPDGVEGT
jgi:hypothetical protein